jgi:hypothetical protein
LLSSFTTGRLFQNSNNERRFKQMRTLLAASVAVTAMLAAMPVARADEATYLEVLDIQGVPYSTPAAAVQLGRTVCTVLESGATGEQIKTDITRGGYSPFDGGVIVGAAVLSLCPQDIQLANAAFGTDF